MNSRRRRLSQRKRHAKNGYGSTFRWLPARTWPSALFVLIVTLAIILVFNVFFRSRRPSVALTVLPTNIEQLDTAVAALIRTHVAHVQANEDDPAAHAELGLVYEANELWREAFDAFGRAVQLAPEDRLWKLHWIIAARETGEFEIARAETRRLARAHPEYAPAQHRLGQHLMEMGDVESAAEAFQRVIQASPSAAEGYVGLADVRLREDKPAAAVELLRQAIQRDSKYRVAHFLLGTAYRRIGRQRLADHHLALGVGGSMRYLPDTLTQKLQQYAVNVKARTRVGMQQMVTGQTKEAVGTFEEILRSDPENITVMNNLAGAYMQLQRSEDALRLLQKSLKLDDQRHTTYVNLANWAMTSGQVDKALAYADAAVRHGPRVGMTHRARASVLFQMGRLDDALGSAQTAAALTPNDPRIRDQCADLAWRLHRFDVAIQHYRKAVTLDPRRIESWIGLTRALLVTGPIKEAHQALSQAHRLAPNDPRVKRLMELIQQNKRSFHSINPQDSRD